MKRINNVALIGGGVIGAGWAARLLINGLNVTVCDPSDQVERRLNEVVENALRAYRKMTLAPVGRKGKLVLLQEVCENTGADVVVASSSSGLLPSEMQQDVRFPERIIIGHPFNPVYLMPLVEIVGGQQTSQQARETAAEFYRSIGMHPLQVRKEIDAFLADRMMEALWREALHLVNEGVATTDEIDQAICYGPGLRWSFMGTFLVYRVAGGEGGMRHFMEQFGPSLKWPWTRFDGPELTDELLDRVTRQSDEQAGDMSISELESLRDDCLVSVLQALRSNNYAAGKVLKRYEEQLYATDHQAVMADESGDTTNLDQPLILHHDTVRPEWVDYNNHMTESRYTQVFGDASDALFRYIGVDGDYHDRGFSYFTVETHMNFLREVSVDQPIHVGTRLLGGDDKKLHLFHTMYATADDTKLATTEQMILHVDTRQGKTCSAEPEVQARLNRLIEAHADLPNPEQVGRSIQFGR